MMRVALAQYALGDESARNLDRVLSFLHEAARRKAQLVVFPELCLSPFFPQFAGQDASRYALTANSDYLKRIRAACRDLHLMASPNVYLQLGAQRFDASLLIDENGSELGVSKMVHIAQLPGFCERDYYAPSDTGFRVYQTSVGAVGIVVCFDRHYPESIRTCALRGAQLIIIPTANTKAEPGDLFECELRAGAMQNGVFIAMCNRVGKEGEAEFRGESMVVDSDGNVAFKADDSDGLFTVELDLARTEESRKRRPYLELRRPDTYER